MKFVDRYKISLHNIKNNKSRSILTTVIVFVISVLVMAIMCFAISFSSNNNKILREYYQSDKSDVTINAYSYSDNGGFGFDNISMLENTLNQYPEYISDVGFKLVYYKKNGESISYSSLFDDVNIIDYNFIKDYKIVEGRNINKSDSNTNKVLVSKEYVNSYYLSNNVLLTPGSTVDYSYNSSVYYNNQTTNIYYNFQFEIVGIYQNEDDDSNNYYGGYSSGSFIADINFISNNITDKSNIKFTDVHINTFTSQTGFEFLDFTNAINKIVKELNNNTPKIVTNYDNKIKEKDAFSCDALSNMRMSKIVGYIFIGFAAFLSLILVLLTIGSLSNTIMISVNKNKKFIGLLKALGLNEYDLKSTIRLESITTITLGVLIAFVGLFILKAPLSNLNEQLLTSINSMYLNDINYEFYFDIPIYVPLGTIVVFVLLTLLFSHSSMSNISKTDPMAVISEVA